MVKNAFILETVGDTSIYTKGSSGVRKKKQVFMQAIEFIKELAAEKQILEVEAAALLDKKRGEQTINKFYESTMTLRQVLKEYAAEKQITFKQAKQNYETAKENSNDNVVILSYVATKVKERKRELKNLARKETKRIRRSE